MPTVLRLGATRFFFYSNEGNEPPHIHIEQADGVAKFWLAPGSQVLLHRQQFLDAWHDHFKT